MATKVEIFNAVMIAAAEAAKRLDVPDGMVELFVADAVDELAMAVEVLLTVENHHPEACPGCGCMPSDGVTDGCDDTDGCGFYADTV